MVMSTPEAGADRPEVSILLRMFSTDVAVREVHNSQALKKQLVPGVPVQESKKLAGKVVRLLQLSQVLVKVVTLETSIKGKLVRPVQPFQALIKLVALEVSIKGKLVRLEQLRQAVLKLVTPVVTPKAASKLVILSAPYQALKRLVPRSRSLTSATDVILSASVLLLKYGTYC